MTQVNINITIPRPGHKYMSIPADLYVTAEYSLSNVEEMEVIDYASVTDSLNFDWLSWANDAFIAYLDGQVRKYLSEL